MNFSISAIMAGFIYGVWGFYLVKFSRKTGNAAHLIIGILLMAYPYFVENEWILWGAGAALLGMAYRLRH